MTIGEALNRIDGLKPNAVTTVDKVKWLSEVDHMVTNEIINTHSTEPEDFTSYTTATVTTTPLLVGEPYEDVYLLYMSSKIDLWNGEYGRYNNTAAAFNSLYDEYKAFYNRHNMPATTVKGIKVQND